MARKNPMWNTASGNGRPYSSRRLYRPLPGVRKSCGRAGEGGWGRWWAGCVEGSAARHPGSARPPSGPLPPAALTGIPADTLMPAPVMTTMLRAAPLAIRAATPARSRLASWWRPSWATGARCGCGVASWFPLGTAAAFSAGAAAAAPGCRSSSSDSLPTSGRACASNAVCNGEGRGPGFGPAALTTPLLCHCMVPGAGGAVGRQVAGEHDEPHLLKLVCRRVCGHHLVRGACGAAPWRATSRHQWQHGASMAAWGDATPDHPGSPWVPHDAGEGAEQCTCINLTSACVAHAAAVAETAVPPP